MIGGESVHGAGELTGALYGVLADANLGGDALCRGWSFPILGSILGILIAPSRVACLLLLRLVPLPQQVRLLFQIVT